MIIAWKNTKDKCSVRPAIPWKLKASQKDLIFIQGTCRKANGM